MAKPRDFKKFTTMKDMAKKLRMIARAIGENGNPGARIHCAVKVRMFQEQAKLGR